MEQGTEWELEAVRERWCALERQRVRTSRFLGGLLLLFGGTVLLVLSTVSEACTGDGGVPHECTVVVQEPVGSALILAGLAVVAGGLVRCWRALHG